MRTPSLSLRSPDKEMLAAAASIAPRGSRDGSPRQIGRADSFALVAAAGAGAHIQPVRGASVDREPNGKIAYADEDSQRQTPVTEIGAAATAPLQAPLAVADNGPASLPMVSASGQPPMAGGDRTSNIVVRPVQLDESLDLTPGSITAARLGPGGDSTANGSGDD